MGFLLSAILVMAQGRTITGNVTDEKGNPILGATVQVKGTKTGATTRADGTFSLVLPSNARSIVFSYVGYDDQEVLTGNQQRFTITLAPDNKTNLGEVVLTGYGSGQRRKNVVASIATVGSKDLENKPFTSIDQMFSGKVAGLIAPSFSGQPGAAQQVRIRGIGSIAAGAGPLFVIDGVILNAGDISRISTTANTLAGINANDIEDVTFLKDAQATSLYGSRGANGVIFITTKKGKAGKTKFRADVEVGYTGKLNIPEAARPLNSDEWLLLFEEGLRNAGFNQATIDQQLTSYGKGTGINTNWIDLITRKGQQQQYNLSASGGEGKTTFYVSGGYFKQEASVIASDFKRYSLTTNLKHTASDKLNFSLNLSANNTLQNTPSDGGAFANPTGGVAFLRPTQNPYNADGSLNISRVGNTNFPTTFNALYLAQNDQKKLTAIQMRGNMTAEYSILKNLKFNTRLGIDYNSLEEYRFDNPFHGDGRTAGGRGFAFYTRIFNWINTNQLIYNFYPDRAKNIRVEALLAYEAQKSKEYDISAQSNGYPPTAQLPLSVNAATVVNGKLAGADFSFNSVISTGSVNYKGKYVISGSFRRDGSSRFSENNRYGNFWSFGGAWNVDKETFFSPNRIISNLKIRGSYGRTGNAGIGNYAWRQTFGYGANYNGQPGGTFNTIGNSDLTWEGNGQLDLGIEGGFLKNRINITADYYKRVSDGLLFADPLSLVTGFASITRNIGKMQNKGLELTVNATPVSTKDFKWDVSFNISFNKNKITKLPGGKDIIDGTFILREGYDYRTYYGRVYVGVDPANGDPLWYKDSTHTSTVNNRSLATREILNGKSASPKSFGGFSNSFSYKGFSITADFIFNYGNFVTDGWVFYLADGVNPTDQRYAINLKRWQKPGDITDVPKYVYGSANGSSSFSTRFLQKGDYIRMRNITLGYNLDSKVASRLHMNSLNFYVRGTNLWTKTYDKNLTIDPEQGVNSASNLDIYYSKTITVGLSLGF
jgi:TonB-linked SusC/RagA family outer membrane protein